MTTRNLATAFAAALNRSDRNVSPPPVAVAAPTGATLVDALRHSATDRDQIVSRRIGLMSAGLATSF